MKDPLGVSPSKGNQGTTRGKKKFLLTSVGIEPTTSGLDLPLLCRLKVAPHIEYCLLKAPKSHMHEDTEVGRCIQRYAGISCT